MNFSGAGCVERGHRSPPPATDRRLPARVSFGLGRRLQCSVVEGRELERADGAVPEQGERLVEHHRDRSTVSARYRGSWHRAGMRPSVTVWAPRRPGSPAPPPHRPAGRCCRPRPRLRRRSDAPSRQIALAQRPTDRCPSARNVLAMPPPITSVSTLPIRLPSSSSLVEILAPPTTAASGRPGLQRLFQRLELGLHQPAGGGRQQPRQRLGRGVRPVRGRKASLT